MSCAKWLFQYPNDILIETGSGGGGGIQYALRYGFKEIHSVEINKKNYDYCVNLFKTNKNVNLYFGDSLDVLPKILAKIKTKATFLLDAHIADIKQIHGKKICPILEELKMIVNHSKMYNFRHSILVDDSRFFSGAVEFFGNINLSDIEKTVMDIDPTYIYKIGKKSVSFT